jgi:hypothetical protein
MIRVAVSSPRMIAQNTHFAAGSLPSVEPGIPAVYGRPVPSRTGAADGFSVSWRMFLPPVAAMMWAASPVT